MDPIAKIRERSREEWVSLVKGYLDDVRIWIEDNGIKASALALVFGMAFILFFKLFVFVLVVGGLVGFFIWSVSLPEAESGRASKGGGATVDVEIDPTPDDKNHTH